MAIIIAVMVDVFAAPNFDPTALADDVLLAAVATGQDAALAVLYDRYGRLVFSLAVAVLGDSAQAEEVIQDVFVQVWNKAATYRAEQGRVVTWLAAIARHRAIDLLRRRGARPESRAVDWDEGDLDDTPAEILIEDSVELAHQQQRVRQAVAALPPEQRRALALAFFKGYTHQQVAEELAEPLGTVKTRIRLGMIRLRQVLLSEIEH